MNNSNAIFTSLEKAHEYTEKHNDGEEDSDEVLKEWWFIYKVKEGEQFPGVIYEVYDRENLYKCQS